MKGAISKLRESGRDLKTPTYIPTLGRMDASLLILQTAADADELTSGFSTIENLGFRQAILWMEEDSMRKTWEKKLEARGSSVIEELLTVHS